MNESRNDSGQRDEAARRGGPGARLAEARERRGLSLEAAAESMGVPMQVLEALETDDWERLEAPVYVRGYLRKYARLLGLPEHEVVAEYESSAAPSDPAVRAHASRTLPRGGGLKFLAPVSAAVVVVILVLAGIWAWHRLHRAKTPANVPAAAVSAMMAVSRNAPAAVSAGRAATATGPAPGGSAMLPAAGTGSSSASRGGLHLVLSLSAPSWVEAYGPGHKRLYYNLAAAGDTLHFDVATGPVTLFLGNAAAASLTRNGKPYPIPAGNGSDKTVRFTVKAPQAAPPKGTAP